MLPTASTCKKNSVFLEEWEHNEKDKHLNKAWLFGAEGEVL